MRKLLSLLLAAALLLTIPFAFAEEREEVTLTMGKEFDYNGTHFLEGQSLENNYYLDYIYDQWKVKFEYAWIETDDYQKDSAAIATGELPDVMIVDQAQFTTLLENDLIQPITEAFEEYATPYMKNARDIYYIESYDAATVKGELYAIPKTGVKKQHVFTWIRQDWADKLGIEIPELITLDEVIEIAKRFRDEDPDGNGENDTIGLPLDKKYIIGQTQTDYIASPIANLMGSYARIWYLKDGELTYGSVTEETRNALEYLAELYADGVFDPQFATRDEKEVVVGGKCGIFFGAWCAGPLQNSYGFDGADWVPVVGPVDEEGYFYTTFPVPSNEYVVVAKTCEHPEAVVQAVGAEYDFHRFLTGDPEWEAKCTEYQNEGVNWRIMPIDIQIENGDIVAQRGIDVAHMIETGDRTGISLENQSFYNAYLKWVEDPSYLTGWLRWKGMALGCNVANYEKNVYTSPVFWGTTATMTEAWSNLQAMEDETFMNIVLGNAGIEAFDEFVEKWYAEGGQTIIDEVQAYLDARS